MADATDTAIPEGIEGKDITDVILSADEAAAGDKDTGKDRGDHPFVTVLDMAVSTGADACVKEGYPAPNQTVYRNFSRPFLNTTMWHYFPDGNVPDDPRIALALGAAGLGLAFAPVLMEVYRRRKEEENKEPEEREAEIPKEEERIIKNPVTGHEYRVADGPIKRGNESPVWMERLQSGIIPGL